MRFASSLLPFRAQRRNHPSSFFTHAPGSSARWSPATPGREKSKGFVGSLVVALASAALPSRAVGSRQLPLSPSRTSRPRPSAGGYRNPARLSCMRLSGYQQTAAPPPPPVPPFAGSVRSLGSDRPTIRFGFAHSSSPCTVGLLDLAPPLGDGFCLLGLEHSKFKDFYDGFFDRELDIEWYHYVWHKKKCLRYSVFTWLAFNGGLKTVDALARRNISVSDPVCPLCRSDQETLNHIFFECNYSFSVIIRFLPSFQSFYLRPSLFQAFQHVGSLNEAKVVKCRYLLILNAIVYHLWRERNNRRFNSSSLCAASIAKVITKVIKIKLSSWKNHDFLLERIQLC
ncbi:hypothetical protein M5K25_020737 [Dendrobium thyrsiflorum]|uniref:Reverse transcriptase zinc-binding domain-containing protein n=1 Tax=Dendrobium thyrsiflorum TaxID=117978 RepID=A0ABD0UHP4_DENTH